MVDFELLVDLGALDPAMRVGDVDDVCRLKCPKPRVVVEVGPVPVSVDDADVALELALLVVDSDVR